MKILIQYTPPQDTNSLITEKNGEILYDIFGPMMVSEKKNRNERIYPSNLMEREHKRLIKEIHSPKGVLMGLDHHATSPIIELKAAAGRVVKIDEKMGDIYNGQYRVLDNHNGQVVKSLLKEKIQVGISTRSTGSLNEDRVVQDDLHIYGPDFVYDQSAIECFIEGTMYEDTEFYLDPNTGILMEDVQATYKNKIKQLSAKEINEGVIHIFKTFIDEMKAKDNV